MPPVQPRPKRRFVELDGIRGWASLTVVVFHLFYETFGARYPLLRNPVAMAFNGQIAVSVFFVLSGEALSAGFFSGQGVRGVYALALKRYARLTIPILASVVVMVALKRTGLSFAQAAAPIVRRQDWLGRFLAEPKSDLQYLRYSVFGVYASPRPHFEWNPFLWTMSIEFFGSYLVFFLLVLRSRLPVPKAALVLLAIAFMFFERTMFFGNFIIGMLLAEWRQTGRLDQVSNWRHAGIASVIGVIGCMIASALAFAAGSEKALAVIGIALVASIYINGPLMRFFSNRLSTFLGKISFGLYLLQYPVIISFTAYLIVFADSHGGLSAGKALMIGAASLIVCLTAAVAFEPVEAITRRTGKMIVTLARLQRTQGTRSTEPLAAR